MNEMDAGRARKPITQEEISLWRLISERSSAHSWCPRSWRGDGSAVGVTQVTSPDYA
jgi:hypothetical protein